MKIEIHTYDRRLAFDLFETSSTNEHTEIQISSEAKLKYDGLYIRKAVGFPEILYSILEFSSGATMGVAAGVVANWLYNKLRGKKIGRIIIERTEIEMDEGEIKRIIKEKLKIE